MQTEIVAVIGVFFFAWLLILSLFVYKTISHYNRLISKGGKDNLQEILEKLLEKQKLSDEQYIGIKERLEKEISEGIGHIQKVGILRYNPFEDTGGDQSFVLAILDGKNTGIVLTSLHSRGVSRWYAKNVREGKGVDHELGKEEEKAIKNSIKLKL